MNLRRLTARYTSHLLACVVVITAVSYFYQVPQNPPGYYIDEASISYNAYTISQNLQDEYRTRLPLYFRAFGEYKNPVYIYLLALLFRLFGPSILVARLFSAMLGVLAAALLWQLSFRVTQRAIVASLIALSALLTPWLFENSRLVFEVALYPALLTVFLLAVHRASLKKSWSAVDVVSLALSLAFLTYSYSIGRLLAPLFALGLIFFTTRTRVWAVFATWGAYVATLVPLLIFHMRHPGALMTRFWLVTYVRPDGSMSEMAAEFFKRYLSNMNPWTMAVTGEVNVRDHVGTMGSILAPSLLIAVLGIVLVILYRRREAFWKFMLYALVVAPIPASLTMTNFPQLRLVAMPVIGHVFMIPGAAWMLSDIVTERNREAIRKVALGFLMLLLIVQGLIYRSQFRKAGPERWYIFDEQFPREVLPMALAQKRSPIYFYDPPGKSGYIQAYWYGVLQHLPDSTFVRMAADEKPPAEAVIISTAEKCSDCRLLLKSINYIVYIATE
ncbi:MAG: ArnT family glycosyltransferase [Pyrinomonadaceae bacterium]